ncbi:MAG: LytR C-terminal domain-containing protein [Austwickia sp.]|nr:LytR C-terminal domain-containing protein [Austwickia sp.]
MSERDTSGASAAERQRRRSVAILTGLGAFLLVSFLIAFAYIQGWIPPQGGPAQQATGTPSRTPTTCPSVPPPPEPKTVTVNVYNATDRAGLAAATAKTLQDQGFTIGAVTNDPTGKKLDVAAEIRFGKAAAAKADVLAQRFPGAVKVVDDKRTDELVDVAIGAKFAAVAPPPTASPTPTC